MGNYFIRYALHGTPFDTNLDDTTIDEDILMNENDPSGYFSDESDDEESEELKKDYVDEYADDLNKIVVKEKKRSIIIKLQY